MEKKYTDTSDKDPYIQLYNILSKSEGTDMIAVIDSGKNLKELKFPLIGIKFSIYGMPKDLGRFGDVYFANIKLINDDQSKLQPDVSEISTSNIFDMDVSIKLTPRRMIDNKENEARISRIISNDTSTSLIGLITQIATVYRGLAKYIEFKNNFIKVNESEKYQLLELSNKIDEIEKNAKNTLSYGNNSDLLKSIASTKDSVQKRFKEVWSTDDVDILISKKYDGDLDDLLLSDSKIFKNSEIINSLIYQCCVGLNVLYDHRIGHGDMRPTNILYKKANKYSLYNIKISTTSLNLKSLSFKDAGYVFVISDYGYAYNQTMNINFIDLIMFDYNDLFPEFARANESYLKYILSTLDNTRLMDVFIIFDAFRFFTIVNSIETPIKKLTELIVARIERFLLRELTVIDKKNLKIYTIKNIIDEYL